MKRIRLLIEYNGTDYVGWQRQKNGRSIQQEIENCLEKIFKKKIILYVAGRTDSGVHALGQVAHFDVLDEKIQINKLHFAINDILKKENNTITILESKIEDKLFHSRFSAKKKTYLYRILNRKTRSHLLKNRVWFLPANLDLKKMKESSELLVGKHNFNAFRSVHCQAETSIRSIKKITMKKKENIIDIRVSGKSFLHNQVRIIVGTLINVGKGKWDEKKICEILKSKDRKEAGETAPSCGLYLEKIFY